MRSLLFILASLMVMSASAQLSVQGVDLPRVASPSSRVVPQSQVQERQMCQPGETLSGQFREVHDGMPYYRRPAGGFFCPEVAVGGTLDGVFYAGIIFLKPYSEYTFYSNANGAVEDDAFWWYYDRGEETNLVHQHDLTLTFDYGAQETPRISTSDLFYNYFQYPYFVGYIDNPVPTIKDEPVGMIYSVSAFEDEDDDTRVDYLLSSKTFCLLGRDGELTKPMTYFSGATPYGDNAKGWWFGKNGGSGNNRIDGIAQAFEKPTSPYLLKQVVMDCAVLKVADQIDMNCRVYKLDEIPAYEEAGRATLPDEPGELIAVGHATLTPETAAMTGNLVYFTLYGEEYGLEYEITPTIDSPILIVVDGYNDPEMANLVDFSAMVSSDMQVDEGFGELAYLKVGVPDDDGNLDHYVWTGLNNFFTSGTMMTGFSIFILTENPYLTFYYPDEDGEFTFPSEGGLMEKPFGDHTSHSIEFWSWEPSADDAWWITCNGDEVPDWLTIELTDIEENGEFTGLVNAEVYAEPLPEGIDYREAVVRFEYPGAYLDYKFMQGEKVIPKPIFLPDVNGDGEVTIADLNYLIYLILTDQAGDANIATVNMLIQYILTKEDPF